MKVFVITSVILLMALIASIAVGTKDNATNNAINIKMNNTTLTNISSFGAVSATPAMTPTSEITSFNISNETNNATASSPYGTPGFNGIVSVAGLIAIAYLALKRKY